MLQLIFQVPPTGIKCQITLSLKTGKTGYVYIIYYLS